MNNQLKDMFDLIEKARAELDNIEQDLQSNQKDLLKFYKRGSKRAGVRVRRNLKKDYKRDKPTT